MFSEDRVVGEALIGRLDILTCDEIAAKQHGRMRSCRTGELLPVVAKG
jgi:hypothetical protein